MAVYGYGRGSTCRSVESPQAQRRIVETYCAKFSLSMDAFYCDSALSGKQPFMEREAGRSMMRVARRGDHVVVPKLDRLSRSLTDFAITLENWSNLGLITHICDLPGGVIDPSNSTAMLVVRILSTLAEHERKLVSTHTKEALARLKAEGRRVSQIPPYGCRWERRGNKTFMAPVAAEQAICRRAAELRSQGHSIDSIRQIFAYSLKLKNRKGHPFGCSEIRKMTVRGVELPGNAKAREEESEAG